MTKKIDYDTCLKIYKVEIGAGVLLDEGKLRGALEAPFAGSVDSEYFPTTLEKAAKLVEAICTAHAFSDGNKRLAWYLLITFLHFNGYQVTAADDSDPPNLVVDLIQHKITRRELALWLLDHTVFSRPDRD